MVKAYVLVEAEIGKAGKLVEQVRSTPGVISAEPVTGPYDVVVAVEGVDIDAVASVVMRLQMIHGMRKTITLMTVNI